MATSAGTPWMLGARADTHDAERRAEIVAAMKSVIAGSTDWLLLETCHRVELYGFGLIPDLDLSLQLVRGDNAVLHVMRVAAGLDSAIVGENEVLHQVRNALAVAPSSGKLDRRLHRLFEMAIAAGRQARRGRNASSANLAHEAMEWLNQRSQLTGRAVLVAGAGHMGSALAHKATLFGAHVIIASRNPTRARRLAQVYGADSADLLEAAALARSSAAIAVALGGPWHELQPSEHAIPPIADISAPPAVTAAVRERANGGYLGIDDLFFTQQPVPSGYIENANHVVEAKAAEFLGWLKARS
jgi:glutamyl-tRNA reductase